MGRKKAASRTLSKGPAKLESVTVDWSKTSIPENNTPDVSFERYVEEEKTYTKKSESKKLMISQQTMEGMTQSHLEIAIKQPQPEIDSED